MYVVHTTHSYYKKILIQLCPITVSVFWNDWRIWNRSMAWPDWPWFPHILRQTYAIAFKCRVFSAATVARSYCCYDCSVLLTWSRELTAQWYQCELAACCRTVTSSSKIRTTFAMDVVMPTCLARPQAQHLTQIHAPLSLWAPASELAARSSLTSSTRPVSDIHSLGSVKTTSTRSSSSATAAVESSTAGKRLRWTNASFSWSISRLIYLLNSVK